MTVARSARRLAPGTYRLRMWTPAQTIASPGSLVHGYPLVAGSWVDGRAPQVTVVARR